MTKTAHKTKNKNTTLIAIDNDYIKWLEKYFVGRDEFTIEELTEFINEVLENHKKSWQELE